MYELRITSFPPLPGVDSENEAVVGVPRAEYLAGPLLSVLTHGGTCIAGPAGTMGVVTPQMVERGLEVLRHVSHDIEKHNEREHRRRQAGLN